MTKFVKGDVVRLKSGSPKMTVEETSRWDADKGIYNDELILCAWFQEDESFSKYFNVSTLEKVS